jgi:hypothetical protein
METYPRIDTRVRALNKAPKYYTAFDPVDTRCDSLQGEVLFSTLPAQITLNSFDSALIPEDGADAEDDHIITEEDDDLDADDADESDEDEDLDEDGDEDESNEGDEEKDIAGDGNSGDDGGDLEGGEEIDEEEDDVELDDHEPDDEFDEDDDDDDDEYGSDWDEDEDDDEYDDDDELKTLKPFTLQDPILFSPSASQEAKPASPSRTTPNPTGQGQEYIGFDIT